MSLVTIQDAAKMLGISYMKALTDERLLKVRANRYHNHNNRIAEMKIESSGRWPMVRIEDIEAYKLLLEKK